VLASAAKTAQRLFAEFRTPVDWLLYLLDLNLLEFAIWRFLQVRFLAMPHVSLDALRPSIDAERDWFAAEYIRRTCRSVYHRRYTVIKKIEV
jgi:hypothetical protein